MNQNAQQSRRIRVYDEDGREYEATYLKRARGLVKNGRARFADETQAAIILACPPDNPISEERIMNEPNIPDIEVTAIPENTAPAPTPAYLLAQIERIAADTQHIKDAINVLREVSTNCEWDVEQIRAVTEAAENVVAHREDTNRALIAFYGKVYDDGKPQSQGREETPEERKEKRKEFQNFVTQCLAATAEAPCGATLPDFEKLWNLMM